MSDDTSKTGADRKLISLEQAHELRDWTKSLGCTEQQLRDAVRRWAIRPTPCALTSPKNKRRPPRINPWPTRRRA